jgi:hypothetical protein
MFIQHESESTRLKMNTQERTTYKLQSIASNPPHFPKSRTILNLSHEFEGVGYGRR